MTLREKNELIVEFLCNEGKINPCKYYLFNSDWNSIMFVVEVLEGLDLKDYFYTWEQSGETAYNFERIEVEISLNSCYITANLTLDPPVYLNDTCSGESKIDTVFNAVVEAIININRIRK